MAITDNTFVRFGDKLLNCNFRIILISLYIQKSVS